MRNGDVRLGPIADIRRLEGNVQRCACLNATINRSVHPSLGYRHSIGPLLNFAALETWPMERRLVAILAADVVGYSKKMEAAEERTAEQLAQCQTLIARTVSSLGGRAFGAC